MRLTEYLPWLLWRSRLLPSLSGGLKVSSVVPLTPTCSLPRLLPAMARMSVASPDFGTVVKSNLTCQSHGTAGCPGLMYADCM